MATFHTRGNDVAFFIALVASAAAIMVWDLLG
jgi:hypothetical protein